MLGRRTPASRPRRGRMALVGVAAVAVVVAFCGEVVDASPTGDAALSVRSRATVPTTLSTGDATGSGPSSTTPAGDGYALPDGASVYARKLDPMGGAPGGGAVPYEAGGGAYGTDFWPASSIKVLAAVGALEYLGTMGFTGEATVATDDGWTSTVHDIYDAAIRESSNEAYDELVEIAGLDWLNTVFLTPENGFPRTVIERSYSGIDITNSPPMELTEGGRTVTIPARTSTADYGCPDEGNCSDLFELTESVRRVVLDGELPAAERFRIEAADVTGLTGALRGADGFIGPGAVAADGSGTVVYDKPGWVSSLDCVDAGVVEAPDGTAYVLGITLPDDGSGCDSLADIAEHVLQVVR